MIASADINPAAANEASADLLAFTDGGDGANRHGLACETRELESGARGKAFRRRRDIASGEPMDEARLLRIAIAPDGTLVPDVSAKLPGRGVWVACDTASFQNAIKKGSFARSAKGKVIIGDDFISQCRLALSRRLLAMLGMALRAGQLEMGYDKVRAMIAAEPPAWRICALDAARDGRNKIRMASKAAWNATPLLACYTSVQLGQALGRDDVTHAALREGPLAERFEREALRLLGLQDLIPKAWETELSDMTLWQEARHDNGKISPDDPRE